VYLRRWFVAVLLVAGLAVPAFSQDAVKLSWKFEKDKPFYQEVKTSTKQTMKVMGQTVDQNQEQTFYFSWTPKENKDNTWTIIQKIEGVKMDIEIAGQRIPYDSTSTKDATATNNSLAEFFKALVGTEFKLTISPDMKVTKIEGRDEFVSKLVKANPQMEPLLKQILGDDALKQMAEAAFGIVPPNEVKKGTTWKDKKTLNMGPIGSYESQYTYTYEGKQNKLDKIKVDSTMTYTPPGPNVAATLPFKIKEAKLQSKDATGEILFDNDKHRVDSQTQKLKLEGSLKIDIGGNTSDVELSQDQTTTVKITDTNPVPAKK
jgi:hypothetical protein